MDDFVDCPNCRRQLVCPTNYAGKLVKCPHCELTFEIRPSSSGPQPVAGPQASDLRAGTPAPSQPAESPWQPRFNDLGRQDDALDDPPVRRWLAPHRGSVVLVFGILSLVACGIFGPVAWILGAHDLREMRAGRMDPTGESNTQAGVIIGMISTLLHAMILLFFIVSILLVIH